MSGSRDAAYSLEPPNHSQLNRAPGSSGKCRRSIPCPRGGKEVVMTTMTAQDNVTLAKKLFELFNDRKLDEAVKYVAPNFVGTNIATGEKFNGPDGYKKSAQGWFTAFPDARAEILNQVANEDYVISEFIGRGIHKGPLETPNGPIAATGKKAEIRFCEVFSIKNGKVVESRLYFDIATMLRQLGLAR
jgi:steroid delta-isomerase-like uncharacterized protein